MTYHYQRGAKVKKNYKKLLLVVPVMGLLGGAYLLINVLSPSIPVFDTRPQDNTAQKLVKQKPGTEGNRLYVPQLNVDVAITEGGSETNLLKGAWHRYPDNGNPEKGGNFVLSGHRFLLGLTPTETRAKSPFYHIDQLKNGDEIFVDYHGKRYAYKVSKTYKVDRTATEIEENTEESKLTLYSCNLRGEKAGRDVVEAEPVGIVAWDGSNKVMVESKSQAN